MAPLAVKVGRVIRLELFLDDVRCMLRLSSALAWFWPSPFRHSLLFRLCVLAGPTCLCPPFPLAFSRPGGLSSRLRRVFILASAAISSSSLSDNVVVFYFVGVWCCGLRKKPRVALIRAAAALLRNNNLNVVVCISLPEKLNGLF